MEGAELEGPELEEPELEELELASEGKHRRVNIGGLYTYPHI